jgi:hypothetical protein
VKKASQNGLYPYEVSRSQIPRQKVGCYLGGGKSCLMALVSQTKKSAMGGWRWW